MPPPPPRVFTVSLGNGESFKQTNLLAVGSSLGRLSMKKFSDWSYCLGPKIRQREGAGG